MMFRVRLPVLALVVIMAACVLTGCSKSAAPAQEDQTQTQQRKDKRGD